LDIPLILSEFSKLTVLDLHGSHIDSQDVSSIFYLIITNKSNITDLSLSKCTPDVSRGIHLLGLRILPFVITTQTNESDLLADNPIIIPKERNTLRCLNLCGSSDLHRDHLLAVVAFFPDIETIKLRGCYKLSLTAIAWMLDGLTKLKDIDLTDCTEYLNEQQYVALSIPVSPPAGFLFTIS